jgi:hypothetical protein
MPLVTHAAGDRRNDHRLRRSNAPTNCNRYVPSGTGRSKSFCKMRPIGHQKLLGEPRVCPFFYRFFYVFPLRSFNHNDWYEEVMMKKNTRTVSRIAVRTFSLGTSYKSHSCWQ